MKFKLFNLVYIPAAEWNNINTMTAHRLWNYFVKPGDIVIDATCGNGFDSLYLAKQALTKTSGSLYCIDIQKTAIQSTQKRLQNNGFCENVNYICGSHETFPPTILPKSVSCITYNLGFLPGPNSDKSFTTKPQSTLSSLDAATKLLKLGGMISIMAYLGHKGGPEETNAVVTYMEKLPTNSWLLNMYSIENKPSAPVLFTAVSIDDATKDNYSFLKLTSNTFP